MAFTYFFRDIQTLESIKDHVIPVIRSRRYINIWDAGCAMGPEPYSLAIILRENMGPIFRNVKIHATDIDPTFQFEKIIKEGVYPEENVKRIPKDIFGKYFKPNGKPGHYVLAQEIRNRLEFTRHNLTSLQPIRKDFLLIVCKNVLLHLQPAERIEVFKMFHSSLAEGGFLVTEQTQKLPEEVAPMFGRVLSNVQLFRKVA